MSVQMIQAAQAAPLLLGWYDRHARSLPWRTPPGSNHPPDPYAVWLSEVMLQQWPQSKAIIPVSSIAGRQSPRWPQHPMPR